MEKVKLELDAKELKEKLNAYYSQKEGQKVKVSYGYNMFRQVGLTYYIKVKVIKDKMGKQLITVSPSEMPYVIRNLFPEYKISLDDIYQINYGGNFAGVEAYGYPKEALEGKPMTLEQKTGDK